MYLKSIEVHGFKSFAHKMIFKFEHGITGIVGPNGSGKSNVADAVRWVLGEQSARQLRGSKMEDVIFSGTELRKPMGSAYVAITLDNSDGSLPIQFEEVTVARRVYRSGESEYLINGSPCRRKDIVELFFDTGIGKEGYSIIGQGQIEQILSGKPEERRELFDEAAGIVKYKKNKMETQKALDAERENLVRVTDILTELKRQVGPLQQQSERAREYLNLRDQLKEEDIKLFLMENQRLEKELSAFDEKIEIADREMKEANDRMEQAKEKYEKENQLLEALHQQSEDVTSEISQGEMTAQRQEGDIKVLKEQINTERTKETHFFENQKRLETELQEKQEQMSQFSADVENLSKVCEEIEKDKIEKESGVAFYQKRIQELETQQINLREQIEAVNSSRIEVSGALERFDTIEEQLNVRISGLEAQKEELSKKGSDNREQQESLRLEIRKIRESMDKIRDRKKDFQKIGETLEKERQEIRDEISRKQEKFHRMQSGYETLKNMAERYDGYGFGIKKVMEQQPVVSGIIGPVADIIKVEQKYETAIETALGGSIQNIVTDTQATAKQMIEYLKKNRYGRVTFLPLDAVKGRDFSKPEMLREPGVIGTANELALYEEKYQGLFASLLGQILIVETMDAGIRIANKYHHSVRIVTLEGDSLNRGGSMAGGAFKNKGNLLGRGREMKELETKLSRFRTQMESEEEKWAQNTKKIKEYQQSVIRLNEEHQESSLKLNTKEMSMAALLEQEKDLIRREEVLEREKEVLSTELQSAKEDAIGLLSQKSDLEVSYRTDEEQADQVKEELDHLKVRAEEHAHLIAEIHMHLSSEKQKLAFQQSNYERVRLEAERIQKEFDSNESDAGNVSEIVQSLECRIVELEEDIVRKRQQVQHKKQELLEVQRKVQEKTESYQKAMKVREEMMERAAGFDKEMFRLQSSRDRQKERQKELFDYMWENYEITYHQAKERIEVDFSESLSKIKEKITELKQQIRGLGSVNVNAIEEYKEAAARYEFMEKQHEDIVTAEAHLTGLMKELEDAMRRQFTEKFRDIRRVFQEVFVELFGGGEARLELTEEDVLESGIQIIAQPPGKKLQNMMQLSGGEKALTAISLLFAIQNLKPSPFCLLDEIEAALDDSNVTRFAQYLHKLTRDTQFIVITHRRGTMMAADVLYGITMQEKGISTQVSVNLIEKDLEE